MPVALAVAVWEFRRFYKLRDQLLSLALGIIGGLLGVAVQWFVGYSSGIVRIAILNADRLPTISLPEGTKLTLEHHESSEHSKLRDSVGRREIAGLLIIHDVNSAELIVAREPVWANDLQTALTDARWRAKLKELSIDSSKLEEARRPVALAVTYHDAGRPPSSPVEKIAAAAFVGLTCLGVFIGMASFFAGVTGEKSQRVTEQVVAAISPQTWVDGKLLGLTAAAFGTLLTYAAAVGVFVLILWLAGTNLTMPISALRPANVLFYLLLSVLGIFFWNCFFVAVAVTINDPNSSARSSLMFLPLTFVAMGFPGLQTPDSPIMRALAVLPGTSSTVMAARMVLSDVAAWEALTAVLLLVLTILVMRRIAGKVFAANILLTGKEPSWRDIWLGMREV
ncbi:MAG: ABC transporter permease [Gemmataceae bacterium]